MIGHGCRIAWWDLANGAFWLDQIALWTTNPDHATQFARDLYGTEDPHLHDIITTAAAGLRAALNPEPGPDQTVTLGPNELDTSTEDPSEASGPLLRAVCM